MKEGEAEQRHGARVIMITRRRTVWTGCGSPRQRPSSCHAQVPSAAITRRPRCPSAASLGRSGRTNGRGSSLRRSLRCSEASERPLLILYRNDGARDPFRAVAVTDIRSGHGHKGHAVTDTSRRAPDPPAGRRARTAEKSWLSDRSHASDHAGHNFHRVRRVATHHTHAFQALALAPPTAMDAACARRAAIVWTC